MKIYKKISSKNLFILLLLGLIAINLLQSYFTEILGDEAYYFLYSKYLDWGYYDHPPMVGLIIRLSSIIFSGNLGVRFVTVLMQAATLCIVWLLLDKNTENKKQSVLHFFLISTSLVMFSFYGFITTPDVPLLFFTAFFLYAYKEFLEKENGFFAFLIALAMAGLVYSKYQAVLVIGFVVLSNVSILANRKFLMAIFLAVCATIPHFYWQYIHDFPSFKYHLIGRSENFRWLYVLEFIPNQLLAFNPFTLIAVLYVLYNYSPTNKFEKAHYYLIIGFILFFALATLKGHSQPQWTVSASISMIILLHTKMKNDVWLRKYAYKFIGFSLFLILVTRIILVTNLIPSNFGFNGKKSYYLAIDKIAENKPVVFATSYRNPSLYTFFTGKKSISVATTIRGNHQFEIWQFENEFLDTPVLVVSDGNSNEIKVDNEIINCFFVDSIQTVDHLKIKYNLEKNVIKKSDTLKINFAIQNPHQHRINFFHANFPVRIHLVLIDKNGAIFDISGTLKKDFHILNYNEMIENEIKFILPNLQAGNYTLALGCSSTFGTTLNSEIKKIEILE
ncbi:MAG: hypothetical protein EAZ53_13915 [Bacteroidetes bacterium]|nr:MAG: hypothetical protein EAZ53_13915 [Bacteroidota bacterium]